MFCYKNLPFSIYMVFRRSSLCFCGSYLWIILTVTKRKCIEHTQFEKSLVHIKYIKTILNNSMETVTNKTNSTDWVLNNPHQIPITPFMKITSGVT